MAIAGKVAITPGGEWSVDFAYDKLVVVTFGNNVYLSIKPSTGIEPTNEEHWMLLIENVTQEQYDNIINGTTTVGNANKLGGKGASEYALVKQLSNFILNSYTVSDALTFDNYSESLDNDTHYRAIIIGTIDGIYAAWLVEGYKRASSYEYQKATSYRGNYERIKDSAWKEWKQIATTVDLANYLPKSGGKVTTVTGSTILPQLPMIFENGIDENGSVVQFADKKGALGHIGFQYKDVPIYSDVIGNVFPLLHTGNKPTGSYTGNGSATQRTINIGGMGYCIAIWSDEKQTMAIVTRGGAICKDASGNITTLTNIDLNLLNCDSSIQLILVTNKPVLNENGITYKYAVL